MRPGHLYSLAKSVFLDAFGLGRRFPSTRWVGPTGFDMGKMPWARVSFVFSLGTTRSFHVFWPVKSFDLACSRRKKKN